MFCQKMAATGLGMSVETENLNKSVYFLVQSQKTRVDVRILTQVRLIRNVQEQEESS